MIDLVKQRLLKEIAMILLYLWGSFRSAKRILFLKNSYFSRKIMVRSLYFLAAANYDQLWEMWLRRYV
jgi:hypothetical protein